MLKFEIGRGSIAVVEKTIPHYSFSKFILVISGASTLGETGDFPVEKITQYFLDKRFDQDEIKFIFKKSPECSW